MDISEDELLAKAVANGQRLSADERGRDAAVATLIAGCDLAFGLYPDQSSRGFNFTVIKGAGHLAGARASRWDVIPFDNADALDVACGLYGDYDWMSPEPAASR